MGVFSGKTVVITGGNSSMGRYYARAFAREGANLLINFDSYYSGMPFSFNNQSNPILRGGGSIIPVRHSVVEPDGIPAILHSAVQRFGKIDVVIHNADVFETGMASPSGQKQSKSAADLFLQNAYRCSGAAARQMIKQKTGGCILHAASLTNLSPFYCNMLQTAMTDLSKHGAKELKRHNIRLNSILAIQSPKNADKNPYLSFPLPTFLTSHFGANVSGQVFHQPTPSGRY